MGNQNKPHRSRLYSITHGYERRMILNDNEIDLLQSKTGLSRQEIQAWHSQFLQDYPSGYINRKDFEKIYKDLYPQGNPDMSSKLAFRAFDIHNAGRITFSEFLIATAMPSTCAFCPEVRNQLEKIFNVYEPDLQNIDCEELRRFLEAVLETEGLDPTRVEKEIQRYLHEKEQDKPAIKPSFNRQESIDFILNKSYA